MFEDFCYVVRDRATGKFLSGSWVYSPGWTDDPSKAKKWGKAMHAKSRVTRMRNASGRWVEQWAAFLPHLEVVKIVRTYFENGVVPM